MALRITFFFSFCLSGRCFLIFMILHPFSGHLLLFFYCQMEPLSRIVTWNRTLEDGGPYLWGRGRLCSARASAKFFFFNNTSDERVREAESEMNSLGWVTSDRVSLCLPHSITPLFSCLSLSHPRFTPFLSSAMVLQPLLRRMGERGDT